MKLCNSHGHKNIHYRTAPKYLLYLQTHKGFGDGGDEMTRFYLGRHIYYPTTAMAVYGFR